jgi:ubiquinone/menaquinone biosynthesis C-methylase UbiE
MRNYLYKLIIDDVTDICYKNSLEYFPPNSRVLDVGIGNGIMIKQYHDVIRSKNLRITGIDINRDYLKHCKGLINRWELSENIEIKHTSVEDYAPPEENYFDYILFSMSFMLFDNQQYVLDRIKPWLKSKGEVLFFQTMFKDKSVILELIKPRLKYVTSIDFGRVTYEKDFADLLDRTDISITQDRMLKREWFRGEYHLIISSPRNGNGKRQICI